MATFIQAGDAIDYTPASDVSAGEVVQQADLIGVATTPIKAGTPGALAVRGVFEFAKKTGTGEDIAAGQMLVWDDANKVAVKPPLAGSKILGKAVAAAGEEDKTVQVRLFQ